MVIAPAIGIDFGTSYSRLAVWRHGKVEIIVNDRGNKKTASCVSFTDSECYVGDLARDKILNPTNTIFNVKRILGRAFDDPAIQNDIENSSIKIVDELGKLKIEVKHKKDYRQFSPEEISSIILTKLKETAENYMGCSVRDVVIGVPGQFNDSQRQAIKNAGTIAGLNVLRILNETTAVALAYGFNKQFKDERNVMVIDLGGGTLDVSILTIDDGSLYEVKATAGNAHLGGEDIDDQLVQYLIQEFKNKHNIDLKNNHWAVRRLKTAAETAKITLTSCNEAFIKIEALFEGLDFHLNISRTVFEALCSDLFKDILIIMQNTLNDAKLNKNDFDDVVLNGGTRNIPKIKELITIFFSGKSINVITDCDEAVACGAAIEAAILTGESDTRLQDILLVDVTPKSLGIQTADGTMNKIINRNSRIPCKHTQLFSTYADNQPAVSIQIFEGEKPLTKDNNFLGSFKLEGLPLVPRGAIKIEVAFDLNVDGILSVSAKDVSSDKTRNIFVENNNKTSNDAVNKLAEEYNTEHENDKMRIDARNLLENNIFQIKALAESCKDKLEANCKATIQTICHECLQWMDNNTFAETDEYRDKEKYLMEICRPIFERVQEKIATVRLFGGVNLHGPIIEEID